MPNKIDKAALEGLVNDFISKPDNPCKQDLCDYKAKFNNLNISDALRPGGKKMIHQNRIPNPVLDKFGEVLMENKKRLLKIINEDNFRSIMIFLTSLGENIKGIGPLTVYDTAKRIACQKNIQLDAVYLHAGALEGAKALGLCIKKEDSYQLLCDEQVKEVSPLYILNNGDIETFLCICKNKLKDCFIQSN